MEPNDAIAILDRLAGRRVLVAGDIMLDRYLWGSVTRLSPEAPVPIVAKQRATSLPGGAANVAVTVAALGGQAALASVTGEDADARELESELAGRGVTCSGVLFSRRRKTTVKTRIIAHSQHLLRVDEEDVSPIDSALAEELLARIEAALPTVTAVVLSDYAKGLFTPELLSEIIGRARSRGLPVLVDPKGLDFSRYDRASLLTPNRAEALAAAGLPPSHPDGAAAAGAQLLRSLAIGALLITEGEAGMTLFEPPSPPIRLPAVARAVYDVTGAGDAVIATLGLAMAAGAGLRPATYLANLAGGIAVEQLGTATITLEALRAVLEDSRRSLPSFSELRAVSNSST